MDDFDYSQFLEDDEELLEAANLLAGKSRLCNTIQKEIFPSNSDELYPLECNNSSTTLVSTSEQDGTSKNDVSRFPEVSTDDIEALRSLAVNKNTSRSTKQWMNVFKKWCKSRRIQNVNIETMSPVELDKLLGKFYAEIKKQDGEDCEPESLRIMQCALERYLKDNGYEISILRDREFRKSQDILNAKAIFLRQQGKGKRPNKAQAMTLAEETALWEKAQLGNFNARVLTNTNFKNLTEQLGLRGRQEHYDSYVEDFIIRQQEDGGEVVEFRESPTKTRSGGLRIKQRSTPQLMFSTDGGERDPVRLFKLWLSKRPEGMKDNGPLYLSIINRPKSPEVWYTKIRMGQNTIGNIMKSMAKCLNTNKKLTNHSMRKTLVSKLKSSGQPRNVICEITGHSRESSLDDYDQIDENQRRNLSHIISGYERPNNNAVATVSSSVEQSTSTAPANTLANINPALNSTSFIQHECLQQTHQPMSINPAVQLRQFPSFSLQDQLAAFSHWTHSNMPISNYTGCTINNYFKSPPSTPRKKPHRKAYMLDSDEED